MDTKLIENIGHQLGEFMLGFSRWLNREIENYQPDYLLFASREGWFMGYCWEILYGHKSPIKAQYILTSRRVLRLAHIDKISDMEKILSVPSNDCSLDFLMKERFGVNIRSSKYAQAISNCGFDSPSVMINRKNDYQKLCKLMPIIAKEHLDYTKRLKIATLKYYGQWLRKGKTIFLVDIGYNGTFTKSLSKLFPDVKIMGRYIATFKGVDNSERDKGWLFNRINNQLKNNKLTRNVPMLEHLMMTQGGSLFDFNSSGNTIKPIFRETSDTFGLNIINLIQLYAYKFLCSNSIFLKKNTINDKKFSRGLLNFLNSPSMQQIQLFENNFLEDSFGGNERRFLINSLPQKFLCVNDEAAFIFNSGWSGASYVLVKDRWNFFQKIFRPCQIRIWHWRKNISRIYKNIKLSSIVI